MGSSHRDWSSGENLSYREVAKERQGVRYRGIGVEVRGTVIIIVIIIIVTIFIFNICIIYGF